ncbi:porin family protein [Massilia sp. CMS3.1]|uniref:porin family protein n=1 Tax=Massilia sp. CMS3.1 TaxID=3373083 RepID=UPI003EE42DE1
MFKKIAAAAILVAASSAAVAVEPQPFYAGIDVGSTKIEGFDREGGYGAFLGYKFNQSIAIEGGYHRLVDTEFRSGPVRGDVTIDQLDLSVIGTLPLSNGFDVYGRLGYNRLEAEADVAGFTGKEHDSNALYGLGMGYSFSPVVHARLEVQKPSSDATRILAGVAFAF